MASTTAMFSALSGMNAASRTIDIVGNNIANVNTASFKSSRIQLEDSFYRTLRGASAPADTQGGSNPSQIGLGVNVAGVTRSLQQGALSATGDSGDMAIEGNGYFVVNRGNTPYYTRAGNFRLDAINRLTTPSGDILQGYIADQNFNVPTSGSLQSLTIPIGNQTIAQATTTARITGNLNSAGDVANSGSLTMIGASPSTGLRLVPTAIPAPAPGQVIDVANLLTDIEDPATAVGSGTALFAVGQIIELQGAQRGTAVIPSERFTITATSTVADLNAFLSQSLGIRTGTPNPDGGNPGVQIDGATGMIGVTGNTGTVNSLAIDSADIRVLDSTGRFLRSPLVSTAISPANGESVRTQFLAFDSLGNNVSVNVTLTLQSKNASGGTTWGYAVDSPDDADPATIPASGTVNFDAQGRLIDTAAIPVTLERNVTGPGTGPNTGAASPLTFNLRFADGTNQLTALSSPSQILPGAVDGLPPGVLQSFDVGRDGTIFGTFSNSAIRSLGRVALATFVNAAGLTETGQNLFQPSSNSGPAQVRVPGVNGAGEIVERSLELSNVDLSQEFINLITASTAFSANSRVITTTDQLFQQLLALGR